MVLTNINTRGQIIPRSHKLFQEVHTKIQPYGIASYRYDTIQQGFEVD